MGAEGIPSSVWDQRLGADFAAMNADQALDIVTNGSFIRSISASPHTPTQHEQPARGDSTADHTYGDAGQRQAQSRNECGGERDQNKHGGDKAQKSHGSDARLPHRRSIQVAVKEPE